jgi:RNA polymerase sigma-70 factor (ECF subfamily)
LSLLDGVVAELEQGYRARGRQRLFAALRPALSADEGSYDPQQVATELGMSPGAVKVAAHRLRRQYRHTLRRRVAETLDPTESVDGELGYLLSVL